MVQTRLLALALIVAVASTSPSFGSGQEQAVVLPAPSGPFAVGTFTHEWRDGERPDDFLPEREHLAAAFTVWYPAASTDPGERTPYDPMHDELLAALRADNNLAVWATRLAPVHRLTSHSFEGVNISDERKSYPLVLVSPGGNVSRRAHTALSEDLASHGYIVCAVSHPYSGLDLIAGELHASHARWSTIDGDDEAARRADDALSDHLAKDASRALDRVLGLAAVAGHVLSDRIDATRVAIVGHSRGGSTVGRACSTDVRFRAAVVLDNVGPDRERDRGLRQPQLAIRTDEDLWGDARTAGLKKYLALNQTAGYEAVIRGASHMSFTDIPFAIPRAANGSLNTGRVHDLTCELVRAFLARHLTGEASTSLEEISSTAPEVTLTVHAPRAR